MDLKLHRELNYICFLDSDISNGEAEQEDLRQKSKGEVSQDLTFATPLGEVSGYWDRCGEGVFQPERWRIYIPPVSALLADLSIWVGSVVVGAGGDKISTTTS